MLQSNGQYLINPFHLANSKISFNIVRYLLQITTIIIWDDYRCDTAAMSCKKLFLESANLQYLTAQGYLSPVMATLALTGIPVKTDTRAVHMPTPAEGPSFGVAPSGTWM